MADAADVLPPPTDTPALDISRLAAFLDSRVPGGLQGPLQARMIAGGRSNPTFDISDGVGSWVLRRPPFGLILPTAHDMRREYRVLSALAGQGYPVPRPLAYCDDLSVAGCAFYVMEKIPGKTLRSPQDSAELSLAQRAALADELAGNLARLHQIDVHAAGLADFGRPQGYLERQLQRWKQQWEASRTRPRSSVDQVLSLLAADIPPLRYPGIVHGDYKLDNLMLGPDAHILAVLDWEMSTYGDTLADVGILLSFWDEAGQPCNPISAGTSALPGFPSGEALLQRYAAHRGIATPLIDWYVAFADVKIAVILEGIHARHLQGHTTGADFDNVGSMVDPLLQRALRRLAA